MSVWEVKIWCFVSVIGPISGVSKWWFHNNQRKCGFFGANSSAHDFDLAKRFYRHHLKVSITINSRQFCKRSLNSYPRFANGFRNMVCFMKLVHCASIVMYLRIMRATSNGAHGIQTTTKTSFENSNEKKRTEHIHFSCFEVYSKCELVGRREDAKSDRN